jgi:dTDP-4-dehydrorhamnose reductase
VDRPAERPAYTCLSVEKLERELGRSQPALDKDIDAVEDAL